MNIKKRIDQHLILLWIVSITALSALTILLYFYNGWNSKKYTLRTFLFLLVLSGLICFKIEFSERMKRILTEVLLLFVPFIMYVTIEDICGYYYELTIRNAITNGLLLTLLFRILYLIFNQTGAAVTVGMVIAFVAGTANHYVVEFRGTPIMPWDIFAARTAADVAGTYHFYISMQIYRWVIVIAIISILAFAAGYGRKGKQRIIYSMGSLAVLTVITAVFIQTPIYKNLERSLYKPQVLYKEQGFLVSFCEYIYYMVDRKPEGYSIEECQRIIDEMKTTCQENSKAESIKEDASDHIIIPSNIIMIMNESYGDLRIINKDRAEQNIMPYWDSLKKNTIKGNLYVPVYGGTTANTEFESLTGNSLIFDMTGGVPFQSRIRSKNNSIASVLSGLQYETKGLHLYTKTNWNRNNVYPFLGFDEFLSADEIAVSETVRNHATDVCDYNEIFKLYENKEEDKLFVFNVTMQNHGGYEGYQDMNPKYAVDLSYAGDFPLSEVYLSLLKMSDDALKTVIEYFQGVDEPTMVIVYGDHQGRIEDGYYEYLYGKSLSELTPEERQRMYVTPFLIWTNYDMPSQSVEKISANYLQSLIMKTANLPMSGYQQFLYDLYLQYPVISVNGIIDQKDNFYSSVNEVPDQELFAKYEYLQYNNMIDKNKIESFFESKAK